MHLSYALAAALFLSMPSAALQQAGDKTETQAPADKTPVHADKAQTPPEKSQAGAEKAQSPGEKSQPDNTPSSQVPPGQGSNAQPDQATPPSEQPAPAPQVSKPESQKKSSPKIPPVCIDNSGAGKGECLPIPRPKPRKIIIRHGSTTDPTAQMVPGMTPEQAMRKRQNTEKLLLDTENAIQRLQSRKLGPNQQETLQQIRNYIAGSHSALDVSDLQRAYTLALKAHLLADDLLKH